MYYSKLITVNFEAPMRNITNAQPGTEKYFFEFPTLGIEIWSLI